MIQKRYFLLFFIASCFFSTNVFSQREIPLDENNDEDEKQEEIIEENNDEEEDEEVSEKIEIYSVFNDFRIPTRENINTSDLRYNGWVTDKGMYTFRCRKEKRIRLTLWYLDKGNKDVLDSEFINITPAIDKCQKEDIEYIKPRYRRKK